ncbi:hypothetical protein MSAN_00583400 [Mycena sanguinolenta]|uniref:F-box domain-containing protein n=1 Tax=Mycena sanguinolenta TaxID=230812 RepID=A0A8H6ZA23_9AGAR|nr:hypothetical protein MSAN_00583400 [Mycena sanguinolenta]
MLYLLHPDLVVLCRTSRLFRNLATPLLYRSVSLSTDRQLHCFVRTMTKPSCAHLSNHVRRFSITDEEVELKLTPPIVNSITSIVSKFTRLEVLDLILAFPVEFTDLLRDASFPHLATFQYTLQQHTALLLPSFLNRHPTLFNLGLTRISVVDELPPDTISLPNLGIYNGPSAVACAFAPATGHITSACLLWYPDDLDVKRALLHLSRTCASLVALMPITTADDPARVVILQQLATHLPHLRILRFRRVRGENAPLSRDAAREIATCLKQFTSLFFLEFDNPENPVQHDRGNDNIVDDRETILSWSAACKSLAEIALHGRVWMQLRGHWRVILVV